MLQKIFTSIAISFAILFTTAPAKSWVINDPELGPQPGTTVQTNWQNKEKFPNTLIVVATDQPLEKQSQVCDQIKNSLNNVLFTNIYCVRSQPTFQFQDAIKTTVKDQKILEQSRFIIKLVQNPNSKEGILSITDKVYVKSSESLTISTQQQRITDVGNIDKLALNSFMQRTVPFFINQNKLRNFWMTQATTISKTVAFDSNEKQFYRCSKKVLNDKNQAQVTCVDPVNLDPKQTEQELANEHGEAPHYVRLAMEMSAVLGISAVWYQVTEFKEDWDYANTPLAEILKKKLITFDAWAYDDNSFAINFKHAFPAGWAFYGLSRANGLSAPWSLLTSFMVSTLIWETLVERKEVTSINDVIFTPYGGAMIGEVGYQLGQALKDQKGPLFQTLRAILDPFTAFHELLKNPSRFFAGFKPSKHRNELNSDFFASMKFILSTDAQKRLAGGSRDTNPNVKVGFVGKKINIPNYLKAGKDSDFVSDVILSEGKFETTMYGSIDNINMDVRNVLMGYYAKAISRDKNGLLKGYSVMVGPMSAMTAYSSDSSELVNPDQLGGTKDFATVLHVLGPSGTLVILSKSAKYTFDLSLTGDLAMVKSYAVERYKDAHGSKMLSELVENRGYYHAYGWTLAFDTSVQKEKWTAGIGISVTQLYDINPNLKFPTPATSKVDMRDQIAKALAYIGYQITENLEVRAQTSAAYRWGQVDKTEEETLDLYGGLQLIYQIL